MKKGDVIEKVLWSIALPGFGQFLNGKLIKGLALMILEFMVNLQSQLNLVIIASFQGEIEKAVQLTDYQWLMFYPCLYMFGIYDAYRDAVEGNVGDFAVLPFALAAFFATVGVIYSTNLKVSGVLLGPVWAPMLFCFLGMGIGFIIKRVSPSLR